jgi:hypothetical protein
MQSVMHWQRQRQSAGLDHDCRLQACVFTRPPSHAQCSYSYVPTLVCVGALSWTLNQLMCECSIGWLKRDRSQVHKQDGTRVTGGTSD